MQPLLNFETPLDIANMSERKIHNPLAPTDKPEKLDVVQATENPPASEKEIRVMFSPGKNTFFTALDPPLKRPRGAVQPVLFWNEGRQVEPVGICAYPKDES